MEASDHSRLSTYREMLLRHLFIGEVLKVLWKQGRHAEVLHPLVDDSGYDVAIECDGILRHIQLKGSRAGSKTNRQNININLSAKPGGCVIWLVFDDDIQFTRFLWLGAPPGHKLPDLGARVSKHTKANAQGQKLPRPALREVPIHKFERVGSVAETISRLFGDSAR